MPRPPRIVIPGIPHHVVQRGNQSRNVFFFDIHRLEYLDILRKQCLRAGVSVQGYCLMDNHVHLIVTPATQESLSSAIGKAHSLFSQRMNLHWKINGHVWQHKFYSCPMDEDHFVRALLYVDRNPVRAGMVARPAEWRWSSAIAHSGKDDPGGLVNPAEWRDLAEKIGWTELAKSKDDQAIIDDIRAHTRTGRPLGDTRFLDSLEKLLGYSCKSVKAGRPSKQGQDVHV